MINLNYFTNTGGVNLFASEACVSQSQKRTEWSAAKNVEIQGSGGIMRMRGCRAVLASRLDSAVVSIANYTYANQSYPIAVTASGRVLRFNTEDGAVNEVYLGFETENRPCAVNYNNGVILFNGKGRPLFYEEGKPAERLTSAPEGLACEVYKARVFTAKGSTLYYCALGNHRDWTTHQDAGFIANFHNDSSPITALKNYGEYLAVYKRSGTYILEGSGPSDFSIKPMCDRGCTGPDALGTVDNVQYFFSGDGVATLGFNDLGQISLSNTISTDIKPLFGSLNPRKLEQAVCVPYRAKHQLWFFVSRSSEELDYCLVWDYLHGSWTLREGLPVLCAAEIEGRVYTGTSDGKILEEDSGDTLDGKPIEALWLSPWFDMGSPVSKKELLAFNVWVYQSQKGSIRMVYAKDYEDGLNSLTPVTVTTPETLVWEEGSWEALEWSRANLVKKSVCIPGTFETLRVGVNSDGSDGHFSIVGYSFEAVQE